MKVVLLNGSPRVHGNTALALSEMEKIFAAEGVEAEEIAVGSKAVRGCMACGGCAKTGKCVYDDVVNEIAPKFEEADGLVVATPVYYASANATVIAALDRLFMSTHFDKRMKVGAAIAVARRAGTVATLDELYKYFTISGMPVASGSYWTDVFGQKRGEAAEDEEGMAVARNLARNMVFLMRSIELGRERYGLPERESYHMTNMIH